MNTLYELNRVGECSEWEPFGSFWFDRFDKSRARVDWRVSTDVFRVFPGNVDRAWEEFYGDA